MSANVKKSQLDRLSNLPNPIIYHILSLMDTKYAVQTCVLSQNWRYHWTHIHSLNIKFKSFSKRAAFKQFVLRILERRWPFELHRLSFHWGISAKPPAYIKNVFEYAISRGVKELETDFCDFPPCFYECKTLEILKLLEVRTSSGRNINIKAINSLGFASLSTLELSELFLQDENNNHDIFSNCLNLKNLKLGRCYLPASENFILVSSSLVYLKILLTCRNINPKDKKIAICAPRLEVFDLNKSANVELEIDKCPVLRKINLRIRPPIDYKKEYFSYRMRMTATYDHEKPDKLVSFNFSKGQFLSCNIAAAYFEEKKNIAAANTGTTVTVMHETEGKRLWYYDGEIVWQSIPSYKAHQEYVVCLGGHAFMECFIKL